MHEAGGAGWGFAADLVKMILIMFFIHWVHPH